MSKTNNARNLGRRICGAAFACAQLASLFLRPVPSFAESDSAAFSRRYSLSGAIEFSYDRIWSRGTGGGATDDFRQLLLLDHRGFLADPNLVSYDVSTTVSHDGGKGTPATTLLGESVELTLLHALPDRWKQNAAYIPHPVWLRFSHESSSYFETTNYGLSFMHYVEPKQRFIVVESTPKPDAEGEGGGENTDLYEDGPTKTAKIVEKDRAIPIPRTFFDYDHSEVKNQGSTATRNDVISLRSTLAGKQYDYRFLFEDQHESGAVDITKNVLQLEPIYRFYDEETRRRIDFRNLLRYEERNGAQSEEANSSASFLKPFGKDSLALTGSLEYSRLSAAGGSTSNYSAAAAGSYTHQFSSRLTNSSELSESFTRNLNVDNHFERLGDTVSADLSQLFRGTASAFLGNDKNGLEYGANVMISTKTRIVTSLAYSYAMSTVEAPISSDLTQQNTTNQLQPLANEKLTMQTVSFRAVGPLLNNLNFQTTADFKVGQTPNAGVISREESGALAGNLSWRLGRTTMALGGNYTQMKVENPVMSESSSTSLYSTLTRMLPYNLLLNLYNTWTKTSTSGLQNGETTTFDIKPSLRWTRGLTTVDSEYSYQRTSGGGSEVTDNRFFVRLVRKFSALF